MKEQDRINSIKKNGGLQLKYFKPENITYEDFMAMVDYIQENGITMYFRNHPNKYIFLDGYQYWVMRENEEDPSTIINRCNLNEYKLSITWKGFDN